MTDNSMVERVARAIDQEAFDSVYAYDMRDRREKAMAAARAAIAAIAATPAILDQLHALTDDQRADLFREFCVHCGSADLPCYCMRDD
ncbi:MAG: hypothetical protein RJB26_1318 [Pseudomonadota bacterium]